MPLFISIVTKYIFNSFCIHFEYFVFTDLLYQYKDSRTPVLHVHLKLGISHPFIFNGPFLEPTNDPYKINNLRN